MVIPAGIDILQPCETDIPGPDAGPAFSTVRTVFPVSVFPARLGTRVDESRLLLVKAGQEIQPRDVEPTHKRRKPTMVDWNIYGTRGRAKRDNV